MPGAFPPVDRQAAVALVVVELLCALLLLFGNRLPLSAMTGATAALLAPVARGRAAAHRARPHGRRRARERAPARPARLLRARPPVAPHVPGGRRRGRA